MARPNDRSGRGTPARDARNASNRPVVFYVVLGAIALAGVAALGWAVLRPDEGPTPVTAVTPASGVPTGARGYLRGDSSAPVQIIEFADFECPSCGHFATVTEPDVRQRIIDAGLANLTYFDLPLPQHLNSVAASMAAACADDQGRFWEMHDAIYAAQLDWNSQATNRPRGVLKRLAQGVGLDVGAWEQCFDSRKHQARIEANAAEAGRRGATSTPTFIIAGQMYRGSMSYDDLKAAVDSARAAAPARTPADTTR